jgi:DNA-binding MarR family transcriptional regulator
MSASQTLIQALHAWAHVFMRRSMSNFIRYARDSGLSMQQLGALFFLHHKGTRGVSDFGGDLGVTSAAASQMIERLVQQGLLERSEDAHDRRVKQIVLTARGKELVEQSMQARQSWMEELTHALTPEQQQGIIASLNLLTETAQEMEPEKLLFAE